MTRRASAPACGSGPAGVLMQYAEEPKGYPLGGSHNAVSVDDCGTAVENLCIIPARSSLAVSLISEHKSLTGYCLRS